MGEITKKQHYVWRNYLVSWTDNNNLETGKVFVYRKAPKGSQKTIEYRELMKIAFENYFYDISGFNSKDISVLRQFIDYFQQKDSFKWDINLDCIGDANTQRDFIEKEVMCSSENIDNDYKFLEKLKARDITFYENSIRQDIINTLRVDMFKAILCQEGSLSDDDLAKLAEKFMQNIDEPDYKYNFNLFFCIQYFRSPRIHANVSNVFEEFKKLSETHSDLSTKLHVNLVTIYFAEMMALKMTQNLNMSMILFDNKSSVPFITGDTPIINISDSDDMALFHYPISPSIAVNLVSSKERLKNITFKIDESLKTIVENLNNKLHENCINEVYSNNQSILEKYYAT